jgi:hypothetical protein
MDPDMRIEPMAVALVLSAIALLLLFLEARPLLKAVTELIEVCSGLLGELANAQAASNIEKSAADLALRIEEDVANELVSNPAARITAADKLARFLRDAQRDAYLRDLSDTELVSVLHATLPKINLGAFAQPRLDVLVEK